MQSTYEIYESLLVLLVFCTRLSSGYTFVDEFLRRDLSTGVTKHQNEMYSDEKEFPGHSGISPFNYGVIPAPLQVTLAHSWF